MLNHDNVSHQTVGPKTQVNFFEHQELLTGFVRLHILKAAASGPLIGNQLMHKLAQRGYRLSPGTLCPMLHAMKRKGYLRSEAKRSGQRSWHEYRTTAKGCRALEAVENKLRELLQCGEKEHCR